MKLLLLLAKGIDTLEATALVDVLEWSRNQSSSSLEIVTCGLEREDFTSHDILVDKFDALAIPGGFDDMYDYACDERLLDVMRRFDGAGKLIASISVGVSSTGSSAVLTGNSDTGRQRLLETFGVTIIDNPVVFHANFVTSSCPATATEAAFKLLGLLTSPEAAKEARAMMGL